MGRRDDILSKIHPKYRGEIEAQLAAQRKPLGILGAAPSQIEAAPRERRIRQSRAVMNKLELAYADMLRVEFSGKLVLPQSVRVRLGNGSWYKCKLFIPSESLFIEVKGPKAFRGGFEALKAAASAHKWARWRLVWKVKGQWYKQEVLP